MATHTTSAQAKRLGLALEDAAGGWLIIAIAAAPWMYGSTRHWAILRLCVLLTLMTGYWLGGLLLQWRSPRLPRKVVLPVLFLGASGWLIALAGPVPVPDPFTIGHFAMLYERFPGSFIVKTPRETMWLFSGLIAALCVTIDLSADRSWRNGFCAAMAIVGASIVILGLVQIRTGATTILWDREMQSNGFFFATFFHHTTAGAFINLVWPLAAALFLFRLFQPPDGQWSWVAEILFWGSIALLILCGLAAQVSRFAQVNGILLLLLCVGWMLWRRVLKLRSIAIGFAAGGIALCGLLGIVSFQTGKYTQIGERWQLLVPPRQTSRVPAPESSGFGMHPNRFLESTDPKAFKTLGIQRLVVGTCARMIPQSGLLGFGPGTWSSTYTRFTNDTFLRTFYLQLQFAHNDYLQAVVEWGILGAAAWAVLIIGAMEASIRRLHANREKLAVVSREEAIAFGCALSLVGVLLHACIDFPLQIPSIQLYVCVLLGLLWASRLRVGVAKPAANEHEN